MTLPAPGFSRPTECQRSTDHTAAEFAMHAGRGIRSEVIAKLTVEQPAHACAE